MLQHSVKGGHDETHVQHEFRHHREASIGFACLEEGKDSVLEGCEFFADQSRDRGGGLG